MVYKETFVTGYQGTEKAKVKFRRSVSHPVVYTLLCEDGRTHTFVIWVVEVGEREELRWYLGSM